MGGLASPRLVRGAVLLRSQAVSDGGRPYQNWTEPLRRLVLISDLSDQEAGIIKELLPDIAAHQKALAIDPRLAAAHTNLGNALQHKGDLPGAIAAYNKALDLPGEDGTERVPLSALDRLLSRAARWRDLGDVLEKEAQASTDGAEQAQLYYRLGALRAGELVDLDGALLAYRDAIIREPAHAGSAYPAEPEAIGETFTGYMDHNGAQQPARDGLFAIAAPHVSPEGGWHSYRAAYSVLGPKHRDRTFVVLGGY